MSISRMGARLRGSFLATLLVSVMLFQSASATPEDFSWLLPKNTDVTATCTENGATTAYSYIVGLTFGTQPVEVFCAPPAGNFGIGDYIVTCSGNTTVNSLPKSATNSFRFTVTDKTAPVLTIASPKITYEATGQLTPTEPGKNVKATDDCGSATITCKRADGTVVDLTQHYRLPVGTVTLTCVATDGTTPSAPQTFDIEVTDKTAPGLPEDLLKVTTIEKEATGSSGAPVPEVAQLALLTASDLVDGAVPINCVSNLPDTKLPAIYPIGATSPTTTTVTCTATDSRGNSASHVITVLIKDTTAPVITPPANIEIEAKSLDGEIVNYEYTAIDIVDTAPVSSSTPASGSKFPFGATTTVTITSKDKYGNSATATFTVKVKDTTAPDMPNLPSPYEIPLDNPTTGTLPKFPDATDSVYGPTPVLCDPAALSSIPITGTPVIVKCNSTDGSGNTAFKDYPVIVVRPVTQLTLSIPDNQLLDAVPGLGGAPFSFTPTASDSLTNPQLTIACINTATNAAVIFTQSNVYPLDVSTIACTVTNRVGATVGPKSFTITVVDRTPPVIKGTSVTVPATAVTTFVDYFNTLLTWSDDITPAEALKTATTCTGAPANSFFPLGTTSITCSTKDAAGNTSPPTTFTITVEDKIKPTCTPLAIEPEYKLTEPNDVKNGLQLNYALPTCVDNIDGPVIPTCTPAPQTLFPIRGEKYTIECKVSDKSGNTNTYTYDFVVLDDSSPLLTVPADVVIEATSKDGAPYTFSPAPSASTVDGKPLPVTCSRTSGDTFGPELIPVSYPVTCTATNPANGKTTSKTFTVTVQDTTPPTIQDLPDIILTADANNNSVTSFPKPSAVDAAGVDPDVEVTCTQTPDVSNTYNFKDSPITVTCTAKDNSGNVATDTFKIIIQRAPAPHLQCPSSEDRKIVLTKGKTTTVDYVVTSSTSDAINCDPKSPVTVTLKQKTTVTCSSTSASGDKDTCSFSYIGVDDQPPKVTVPADITQDAKSPQGNTLSAKAINATATDDVDGDIVPDCTWPGKALGSDGSAVFPIGTTTITCKATDSSGNSDSKSFTVTIKKDNIKPVICTSPCVSKCAVYGGYTGKTPVTITASARDNLDGRIPVNGTGTRDFPFGKSQITLSATDSSGNVATQIVTVTIYDCFNPQVMPPGTIYVDSDQYGQGQKVTYPACWGRDDVTPPNKLKWSYSVANGTVFKSGSTTVKCTATDEAGKKGYAKFTVYVRSAHDRCKRFQGEVEKSKCGLSAVVAKYCQQVHDKKEKEECDCHKEVGQKLREFKMDYNTKVKLTNQYNSLVKPKCGFSSSRKSL